ncbi:tRNA adenosine(34) deaminase TadA [Rhodoferax sp.]|uniref:tRNA adenosine(34) deaminase TadA n=1 Tax=Rhodoferax sp. TaxID=50421 RepID=UPI00261DDCA6|nr:tRNA adenosine(34) deaminase TadA [Rhodoferax sp.]MDD5480552.1 tRNA adenosine(34) deaminase TadA [Rhodoferax sp.]
MTAPSYHPDTHWMRAALAQAQLAQSLGEVPVGAVLVCGEQIIATGHNASICHHDPTAHAEMLALRMAAAHLQNYRLEDCEMFVTLEPCAMCAGAMLHARLKRVVFGAVDPKTGAAGSVLNVFAHPQLNHQTQVQGGLLANECGAMLQAFFKSKRQQQRALANPLRDDALRTPLRCFEGLAAMPGTAIMLADLPALQGLHLHYVDAGPPQADAVVVFLHGQHSWSQLWRSAMLTRVAQGARVLALDMPGFGRSDKPKKPAWHTQTRHAQVLWQWLRRLNVSMVLLLEPQGDELCFPADTPAEATQPAPGERFKLHRVGSVSDALLDMAQGITIERESCAWQAMPLVEANAPYPHAGYRAAMRVVRQFDEKKS